MENTPYNYDDAVVALKVMINDWISFDEKRSKSSLARNANISESTIRRIMNDGVLPQPHNICKIVSFIKGVSTNRDLLEKSGPSLEKVISFHLPYKAFVETKEYVSLEKIENSLASADLKLIFIRSSMGNGVTKEEIQDAYGTRGLKALQKLIDLDLVHRSDDNFYICRKDLKKNTFSTSAYKEISKSLIENFYRENADTNYMFVECDSVSISGFGDVMDILKKAHLDIRKKIDENPGDIPLFATSVMDKMTTLDLFNEEADNL